MNGDGTQLTVNAPAGTVGAVQVVVTTPGGSSPANPPTTTYTYVAVQTVTGVSPPSGPVGGGVPVTISGTGFVAGQTTVTFGGNDGIVTAVNPSGTQMTVTTPAGTAGAVDVVVTTPGGSSPVNPPATTYTYVAAVPTVSSITPNAGPLGPQVVTISGTGFVAGQTAVTFGGRSGTNVIVNSATQLTVTTPAFNRFISVQVIVTTPGGSSPVIPPATTYTYATVPTVSGVSPSSGPRGGGVPVTISGTGFVEGQTTVTFGGNGGTVTTVSPNHTEMTVITPAGTVGAVDVVVTTPGGSVTKTGGYTYVAAVPTVNSITPDAGPLGPQVVTISGTGFVAGQTAVTFGGNGGTVTAVNPSGTQMTVTTPAGTVGAVDVVVTTPGGSVTQTGGYTYVNV